MDSYIKSHQVFSYAEQPADLHIAANFDAQFYLPAGVMLTSLFENNRDIITEIHLFTDCVDSADLERVKATAKHYRRTIHLYFLNMEAFQGFHIHHHHYSRVAFARLYMPEVMIDYAPRYLYLDADILVIGKLAPLIDWDIQGKTIAGAPLSDEQIHRDYFAHFWKLKHGITINAGIMLVDAKRWIEKGYTEKVFAYQGKPTKMFIGHDQDIINMALDGDITYLPRQYNDEAGRQWLAGKESVILHFVGRIKPWKVALEVSPLVSEWRKYAKLSQWDAPETALPPKIPKNYYYFKFAAKYFRERKQWFRALYAYLTYLQLKSRQSLQQK